MKITIEATEKITTLDGVPVRLWNGVTESGATVLVFVHRIAAPADDTKACAELELALMKQLPPGRAYSLREVL